MSSALDIADNPSSRSDYGGDEKDQITTPLTQGENKGNNEETGDHVSSVVQKGIQM